MRLRPTLLALAIAVAASTSAGAQTAAPAARPATATQPAIPARPSVAAPNGARQTSATKPATGAVAAPATKAEPIDINTATKTDLQTIPGIGNVYAGKIIANRPYHSKDELTRKKVLPAGVYAKVKDRLIARQH